MKDRGERKKQKRDRYNLRKREFVSDEELKVLERHSQLDYDTDTLGPTGMLTTPNHINSSRLIMNASQMVHFVSIEDPEGPRVPTGMEKVLGQFSHMTETADAEYKVVKKFVKNQYYYLLILYSEKTKTYHAIERVEVEEHSSGFCTRYNNRYLDSLDIGDTIPEGMDFKKSENFDKHGNYRFGKNVNVVYMASTDVYEDGILAMNGVENMFNTFRSYTIDINLADNEILVNLYGTKKRYQGFPLVGERVNKGIVAAIRKVNNSNAAFAQKNSNLMKLQPRGDRIKILPSANSGMTGKVIDINIITNKDRNRRLNYAGTELINELYDKQQAYYFEVYEYMQDILDRASSEGYTCTDWFTVHLQNAIDNISASAFFADEHDGVYGNTMIRITVLDDEHLVVGSKLVGRSGNKGVLSKILPPEKSWHMENGEPIHFVVAGLGIVGRLNPAQLYEHAINDQANAAINAMKMTDDVDQQIKIVAELLEYLNPEEATAWKKYCKNLSESEKKKECKKIIHRGIKVVQEPLDNANIIDIAAAYKRFPPNYQKIIFEDGTPSLFKVICAPMFYVRLKQDPIEKYSCRSRGPVNMITTLPSKSNRKRRSEIPYGDVPVRIGEIEIDIGLALVPYPAMWADYMMENSTSYEAKQYRSEQEYMGEPDEPVDMEDFEIPGKKNAEYIEALLTPLGTDIDIEIEYLGDESNDD